MKTFISFVVLALFFVSCGYTPAEEAEYPQDLEGKKALLKQKRTEFRELSATIGQLEKEIQTLDPSMKKKRSLVTTMPLAKKEFKHFVEIQGSVQSDNLVSVTSEVGGRILQLNAKEGQNVRKGQLIAKLDLEAVNKQIDELETSLELAKTVFERQSRLWDQNIGSEIQYLEAKNGKERLEKSLETIRHQLTKAEVYAPISGVVQTEFLNSGEVASPGAPIVQILNTNKVKVVADVPENYLRAVRRGEKVSIEIPAIDYERDARVSLIGSMIDPSNRTFSVEVELSNPGNTIKPNLLAMMHINDETVPEAIAIPIELVQQEVSGKTYVLVTGEGEEGLVSKKVYVTTGLSFNNQIVIEEGLTGEEQLIVEGALGLVEKELIEVKNTNLKTAENNG